MQINSDINILGGLPSLGLVREFILRLDKPNNGTTTSIRTEKSVRRFDKAIRATFIDHGNDHLSDLLRSVIENEGVSGDSLMLLFLVASFSNELFDHLNQNVLFPAVYSGRTILRKDEAVACLKDLQSTETSLSRWSQKTIDITGSKYLTLLKKFGLLEGSVNKTIKHPYLSDKAFVLYLYWYAAVAPRTNLLASGWLPYCFNEPRIFIERVRQQRFAKFISLNFSGDKLLIQTLISYGEIYDAIIRSETSN